MVVVVVCPGVPLAFAAARNAINFPLRRARRLHQEASNFLLPQNPILGPQLLQLLSKSSCLLLDGISVPSSAVSAVR